MSMRTVFFFDSMVTPKIITILYWLMLFISAIGGFRVFDAVMSLARYGTGSFIANLAGLLSGLIVFALLGAWSRIISELLIVVFKIHENLKSLAEKEQ